MDDNTLRATYKRVREARSTARQGCPSAEAVEALAKVRVHSEATASVFDHVLACRACTEEYELLRSIHAVQRPAVTPAMRRWAPLALAAGAILAVGLAGVWRARESDTVRGGASEVTLVGPPTAVGRGDSLHLVWRAVPNAASYRVDLLQPTGGLIASVVASDTSAAVSLAQLASTLTEFDYLVVASRGDGNQLRSSLHRVTVKP